MYEARHPGPELKHTFAVSGIKQKDVAARIGMLPSQLSELLNGKRRLTADVAVALEKAYHLDARLWCGIQSDWDVQVAREKAPPVPAGPL